MDNQQTKITVTAFVKTSLQTAWEAWTKPDHITRWCFASDDWHAPRAENDPWAGGKFLTRMEAKDGSFGFDFEGVYDEVIEKELITYSLADGRQVLITFKEVEGGVAVSETFDPENENPRELQQNGWQSILDNYRKHAESL
jgi:uncharacterized protein YndB with AHSA1/START domain